MTAPQAAVTGQSASSNVGRIGVKFFVRGPGHVDKTALIAVFHEWIQLGRLNRLLIDVADYTHVHHGPGVVLIAHEGQYSMDQGAGRPGLQYQQTRWSGGSVRKRLFNLFDTTLTACQQLEQEDDLAGTVRFRTDEILFRVTDRLLAPNTDDVARAWCSALGSLLTKLYRDATFSLERDTSSSALTIHVSASASPGIRTLMERLSM
ncbi:MAG: hypothetical protein ACE5HT_01245 [Gemmatimonadales bacterium]